MKKSLYEQTMDSITAPESAVESMLTLARESEKEEKIIPITSRKPHHIKRSIIAASVALALVLGTVLGFDLFGSKGDNAFVLTVNAAQISENAFTSLGSIDAVAGSLGEGVSRDGSKRFILEEEFGFDCICQGDNIRSVTYTAENATFVFNEKYIDDSREYLWLPDASMTSFTLTYDGDFDVIKSGNYDFGMRLCIPLASDDEINEEARQALEDYNNYISYKLNDGAPEDFSADDFDLKVCLKTLFDAMLDKVKVDIEVAFKDGSTQTATMIFRCESVDAGGRSTFSAKLI